MRLLWSIVIFTCLSFLGPMAGAETTINQVTDNGFADSFPQVESNYLVWQGFPDGDWEIFVYDLSAATTTQITDNGEDDTLPQTDGEHVVWQGFRNGETDIFLWDGSQTWVISELDAEDLAPKIQNGRVVWTSQPVEDGAAGPGEIILYHAAVGTALTLSAGVDPANVLDDTSPRISSQGVSWLQTGAEDNTTIYFYSFSDGTVVENPVDEQSDTQQRDGTLSVLTRYSESRKELFLCSQQSRRFRQITDNAVDERYPALSGNLVAWVAEGDIFLAKVQYVDLVTPTNGSVVSRRSPPTFSWEALGYNAFKVAFSSDPAFPDHKILTLPLWTRDWLSDTSLEPSRWEWILINMVMRVNDTLYWRVKGKDAAGQEGLSEPWSFSMEESRRRTRRIRSR